MFECCAGSFVNQYGYPETYISKCLESYLSGHLCRGSAIETCDTCGNCDGGRCSTCTEVFQVVRCGVPVLRENEFGLCEQFENVIERRRFTDKDEALSYYNSL